MAELTPAMQQYMKTKKEHPDCLILFRMGDFYETFFDDAKTASNALGIVLTKRGKNPPVPLAGIPYHSLDQYLAKLIKQGFKVAIVEQMEDPKKAVGLVKRDLIRIITPGTLIEGSLLNEGENNYLMSIAINGDLAGIAFADISTGEFRTTQTTPNGVSNEIAKYRPKEVIFASSLEDSKEILEIKKLVNVANPYAEHNYFEANAKEKLESHFGARLESFGIENKPLSICSSGALLNYLYETQKNSLKYINKLKYYSGSQYMLVDLTTQRNLELLEGVTGRSSTLLHVLDRTQTSMGKRLLKTWISRPLLNIDKINRKLDAVEELVKNPILRQSLQAKLREINDIERLISRIAYGNANAKDLVALKNSLNVVPGLKELIKESKSELLRMIFEVKDLGNVAEFIGRAIKDEPSPFLNEGNIIKHGYNKELDELRQISHGGKSFIQSLEASEKAKTGIKSLKIGYNRIFGYYIEVSKSNLHLVPAHYIRKQTQVNAERFVTPELKEKEEMILNAEEKEIEIELTLFREVLEKVSLETPVIQGLSHVLSGIDICCSYAAVAADNGYVRPKLNAGFDINIVEGRHPVVEQVEDIFIPNDTHLNKETSMMIITGPNMAGKSVYMRQVALICLMAQIGSFVPAKSAEIGIVDRIFTRVGAFDDLSHGQSTFMVEMTQTAAILNNATEKSLIILDEIGRGTSTYDGLSIAWGVAEYITKHIKAKTLFATHYHLLNELASQNKGIKNFNIAVREEEDNIVFLHKIISGGTDKSYGIHVAKLAGMPKEAIEKAREIAFKLEDEDKEREKVVVEKKTIKEDNKEEIIQYKKNVQKRLDEV